MSILERVQARFHLLETTPCCEVPEWGEVVKDEEGNEKLVPLLVYAKPWTVKDDERFAARYGRDGNRDWSIDVVIDKACDADGEPLFDRADRTKLKMLLERHVVFRVAAAIQFSETVEGAKKNSPSQP